MSYQDVKDKLYHGHRKIANNTYLELRQLDIATVKEGWTKEELVDMRLHGNLVAKFYPTYIELYSAGWHTRTTKDRLNLALKLAGISGGVNQEDYTWFLDIPYPSSSHQFYDGMRIDYTGKVIN